MPQYQHKCLLCKAQCEIDYQMKFVGEEDKLPLCVKQKITCNKSTCKKKNNKTYNINQFWPRVPYAVHVANMIGGTSVSEKDLLNQKQQQRKLRSRAHFKNEVLPTIKDPHAKKHFEKKYKGTKNIDHEKL